MTQTWKEAVAQAAFTIMRQQPPASPSPVALPSPRSRGSQAGPSPVNPPRAPLQGPRGSLAASYPVPRSSRLSPPPAAGGAPRSPTDTAASPRSLSPHTSPTGRPRSPSLLQLGGSTTPVRVRVVSDAARLASVVRRCGVPMPPTASREWQPAAGTMVQARDEGWRVSVTRVACTVLPVASHCPSLTQPNAW